MNVDFLTSRVFSAIRFFYHNKSVSRARVCLFTPYTYARQTHMPHRQDPYAYTRRTCMSYRQEESFFHFRSLPLISFVCYNVIDNNLLATNTMLISLLLYSILNVLTNNLFDAETPPGGITDLHKMSCDNFSKKLIQHIDILFYQ